MDNRTAKSEFRMQLSLATYAAPEAHPQDLPACHEREKFLDRTSERMWSMAFRAGIQWAEEQGFNWDYADRDET